MDQEYEEDVFPSCIAVMEKQAVEVLKAVSPRKCHQPTGRIKLFMNMMLAMCVSCGVSRYSINRMSHYVSKSQTPHRYRKRKRDMHSIVSPSANDSSSMNKVNQRTATTTGVTKATSTTVFKHQQQLVSQRRRYEQEKEHGSSICTIMTRAGATPMRVPVRTTNDGSLCCQYATKTITKRLSWSRRC